MRLKIHQLDPKKKKFRWHTSLGNVEIIVQTFLTKNRGRAPNTRVLPIRDYTGIDHLKYSKRLCRLTTDMAAETSFAKAASRMLEHHQVEVPVSAVRKIALASAQKAKDILEKEHHSGEGQHPQQLVLEMDGVMVPIVEYTQSKDRRKTKELRWMEMKVAAIQDPSRVEAKFACSFEGANALGDKVNLLIREIRGEETPPIHGVGDGASWIREQGERIGGCQYCHLIDFFHFSEYLYKAFDNKDRRESIVKRCQNEAKAGEIKKVVRRLHREKKKASCNEGVRDCLRYIKNRPGEFLYAEALAKGLPIGSGLIESTNRSLIQKRLKLPGAWWLSESVENMAQLRTLRANDDWERLWEKVA